LANLDRAIALGLRPANLLHADPDWRSLRDRTEVQQRIHSKRAPDKS